jgi:hypothetical protein
LRSSLPKLLVPFLPIPNPKDLKLLLKYYYPKVEYSEAEILHDTKSILYQNFVEKYSKQMPVSLTFVWSKSRKILIEFDE